MFFLYKLPLIRTDPPSPLRASLLTLRAMSRGSSCQCCLSGALDGELIGNASLTHVARSRPAGVWDYHFLWDRHFWIGSFGRFVVRDFWLVCFRSRLLLGCPLSMNSKSTGGAQVPHVSGRALGPSDFWSLWTGKVSNCKWSRPKAGGC